MSPAVAASALAAVIIWGASPVATRLAVAELPPLIVAGLRTMLGGGLILPLLVLLRIAPPRRGSQIRLLVVSSFCGFIGFPILFSFGQLRTSAVHGAMILALLPVLTGAIAMAADRRWPLRNWWIGCAVAVAGEAILVAARAIRADGSSVAGDLTILIACLFASTGYVAGARLQQTGYPALAATFWGAALATLALLPALPWIVTGIDPARVGASAWASVAYLGIGVTIVGYVLWYYALGTGGIARVGLFQFLQPLSGLLLAGLLLHEPVGAPVFAAAALILAGIWIATRLPPRRGVPDAPATPAR